MGPDPSLTTFTVPTTAAGHAPLNHPQIILAAFWANCTARGVQINDLGLRVFLQAHAFAC